jgi:hypothetical protein
MAEWAPIEVADALELLSPDFKNDEVCVREVFPVGGARRCRGLISTTTAAAAGQAVALCFCPVAGSTTLPNSKATSTWCRPRHRLLSRSNGSTPTAP